MKKTVFLLSLVCTVVLFNSCLTRTDTLRPRISGKAGEVLVVIPQQKWDAEIGEAVMEVLSQDQSGLPQSEPFFNLIHVVPDQFSRIFTSHRNILLINVQPSNEKEKITVQRDQWATPQLLINIYAKSDSGCARLIRDHSKYLVDRINLAERERVIINYKRYQEVELVRDVQAKHGLTLFIPKGYRMKLDSAKFTWVESETPKTLQGIFIYSYPYTGKELFTKERLIEKRNRMLKYYVPGPVSNSWMTTEDLLPPEFQEFEIEGRYIAELRGLWKVENSFMGGPFVSLSTVDEARNRVVTVEGYVYAPNGEKRELLRQVESILHTLKFRDPE